MNMRDAPDEATMHRQFYDSLMQELYRRELSNSDNFDKSVLMYSSVGLAFSLGFLKDFIPITAATGAWMLYASWVLFTLATIFTFASFITSQRGIKLQRLIGHAYHILRDDSAADRINRPVKLTEWANVGAGVSFIVALILTVAFVSINMKGASQMLLDSKYLKNGAPIPTLQQVPGIVERGAPVPEIQKVPQAQPQGTPPAQN